MRLCLKTFILVLSLATTALAVDRTPLMLAAADGNMATVQKILKSKTDLDIRDDEGHTALYYSLSNEHTGVSNILIDSGATLKDISGDGESALFVATSVNNLELMKKILKKDSSLLNAADSEGTTPLMVAAKYGSKLTLKYLLESKADSHLKNKLGQTALQIAQESQNKEAAKILQPLKTK